MITNYNLQKTLEIIRIVGVSMTAIAERIQTELNKEIR